MMQNNLKSDSFSSSDDETESDNNDLSNDNNNNFVITTEQYPEIQKNLPPALPGDTRPVLVTRLDTHPDHNLDIYDHSGVRCISWSHSNLLAIASYDRKLYIYDSNDNDIDNNYKLLHTFDDHDIDALNAPLCIEFSPSEKNCDIVASAGRYRIVFLHDARNGKLVAKSTKHLSRIGNLTWIDSKFVVTCSADKSIQWHRADDFSLQTMRILKDAACDNIMGIQFSRFENLMISCGWSSTMSIWKDIDIPPIQVIENHQQQKEKEEQEEQEEEEEKKEEEEAEPEMLDVQSHLLIEIPHYPANVSVAEKKAYYVTMCIFAGEKDEFAVSACYDMKVHVFRSCDGVKICQIDQGARVVSLCYLDRGVLLSGDQTGLVKSWNLNDVRRKNEQLLLAEKEENNNNNNNIIIRQAFPSLQHHKAEKASSSQIRSPTTSYGSDVWRISRRYNNNNNNNNKNNNSSTQTVFACACYNTKVYVWKLDRFPARRAAFVVKELSSSHAKIHQALDQYVTFYHVVKFLA